MKTRAIIAAVASLVVSLVGWSCGSSKQSPAGPCTADAQCKSTEWCNNGTCVPLQTDGGTAQFPLPECTGANSSPSAGQNCGCSFDCDVGELCFDERGFGIPGGVCSRGCGGDPCPAGLVCVELETGGNVCDIPCKNAADCPKGGLCRPRTFNGPFVCTEHCQSDSDCPLVGKCDRYTGECSVTPTWLGNGDVGDACETPNDCRSGVCFPPSNSFPAGYCTAYCAPSMQGCPAGAFCVLAIDGGEDYGACFKECTSPADCRLGYGCVKAPDASVCAVAAN
ncbi:MAG TPA: hypothetical protein PKA88_31850 [Polyangiaceae bacterium]|nr:hypothetical protein [Polyangiaceae bacterium]